MLGRYIDALPDRAKDRLITGQEWCAGSFVDEYGARCLRGHVEDWKDLKGGQYDAADDEMSDYVTQFEQVEYSRVYDWFKQQCNENHITMQRSSFWSRKYDVACTFDALWDRFGEERITRAVKMRAARSNHVIVHMDEVLVA